MRQRYFSLIGLFFPIILGQLGQMLITAGDVYVAGLYSTNSVAAIGVAGGIINPFLLFGIGLMMGISPFMAYLRGKGQNVENQLSSVLFYSFSIGIFFSLLMFFTSDYVELFGVVEELVKPIRTYIKIVAWSFPFAILFQAVKEFLQAKEKVMVPNIISISSVFINVGLNFVLVFGFAGVGGIGEIGLAYASLSIRVLMLICILVYLIKSHVLEKVSIKIVTDLFKFNFPIGFLFFIEVLAFCTVTVLSGKFGVIDAAANNLIITFASISFMVPLSLASASSVKVGHSYGEQNLEKVNGYIKASLSLGGLYILFSMSMFLLFPKYLLAVSTNDPAVIELGVKLFFIVALFQVADVLQVILTGILRGLGVTKLPSFLVFLGYWLIGIPTGSYLAFNLDMRTQGLWWGLATALTVGSLFLFGLFFIKYLPKLKDNSLSV